MDMNDDPPPLPKGKELEETFLLVKSSDIIKRLDWARTSLSEDSNAWKFITHLAETDPRFFIKVVDRLGDWSEIDEFLRAGNKIRAIKHYREKTGMGLRESKEVIDKRLITMGMA